MALIAILIALLIERFLGSLESLRSFDWFMRYSRWLAEKLPSGALWQGPLAVIATLAGPVVAVLLLSHTLDSLAWLLGFLFSIAVLLYSIGPKDLEAEVEAYVDAMERGDSESASWHAKELLCESVDHDDATLNRLIMECILVEAHERLLGILFWFVLLGPMGALLYRLCAQLRHHQRGNEGAFAEAVMRMHQIMGWLPARITALAYALGGSFVEAMHLWRKDADQWLDGNRGVLVNSGLGAMRYNPDEDSGLESQSDDCKSELVGETIALVRRAVLVFLMMLALLILSGLSP